MQTHGRVIRFAMILLAAGRAGGTRAGIIQSDLIAIRGDQSRTLLGTGRGVTIAVLDGGIDVNHPALRGSVIAAQDFSNSGTTDDDRSDPGHGTGIAALMLGHDTAGGYAGLAPDAKLINARVVDSHDRQTNQGVGDGLFWSLNKGATIVNMSLGNTTNKPGRDQLNLMVDYAAEHYHAVVAVAAGNENTSAVSYTPGGNFNGITVGATGGRHFDKVTDFSNYSLGSDVRTKPELVAPGMNVMLAAANWEKKGSYYPQGVGTSFSAPIVGGVAAQLMGFGYDHGLSTDPLVLKAVMMAGAAKTYHNDGSNWAIRHVRKQADGNVIDQPLDVEMGAGRVDGVGAYNIYARHTDSTTRLADWKLSSMRQSGDEVIDLGSFNAGQHLDATLDWYRHVERTDNGPRGLDGQDTFYSAATLADFSLTLLRDGKKVVTSDTNQDNFENISLDLTKSGDYTLEIYRFAGSGLQDEPYALAMRVLEASSVGRARRNVLVASKLSTSRAMVASMGALKSMNASAIGSASVPEPGSIGGLVGVLVVMLGRRRRRARNPHPNPPPEYRERGQKRELARS